LIASALFLRIGPGLPTASIFKPWPICLGDTDIDPDPEFVSTIDSGARFYELSLKLPFPPRFSFGERLS
jgi:hypothetical protein